MLLVCPQEVCWRGAETKKPTARFASGGGFETFSSLLAVSPGARSDRSLHNSGLRRSRNGRRRRGGLHSLRGQGQHAERIPQLSTFPIKKSSWLSLGCLLRASRALLRRLPVANWSR